MRAAQAQLGKLQAGGQCGDALLQQKQLASKLRQQMAACQGSGNKPGSGQGGLAGAGSRSGPDKNGKNAQPGPTFTVPKGGGGGTFAGRGHVVDDQAGSGGTGQGGTPEQVSGPQLPGDITGQMYIDLPMQPAQAQAAVRATVAAAARDAQDAVEEERVPQQYHESLRKYFDRLAGLGGGGGAGADPNNPAH